MEYQRHAYNRLPDHTPDEFQRLVDLIEQHGFNPGFPITLYEGAILDGWHRYQACEQLGVAPVFRDLTGSDEDAVALVKISMAHRSLTTEQRAAVGAELLDVERGRAAQRVRLAGASAAPGRPSGKGVENFPPLSEGKSRDLAGEAVGLSGKTVEKAAAVKDTAPDVFERMKGGQYGSVERAKRVAEMPALEREQLHDLMDSGKTAKDAEREVRKQARRAERVETINQMADAAPVLDLPKQYPVIYADPPWQYEHVRTESRAIENQYPTMALEEICELPVDDVAARDAVLFLWVTAPKLEEGLQVVRAWGFNYRTCMVWDKEVIGMGYYARQQHELLLICTRGKLPVPEPAARRSSVFRQKRGKHSAKPHAFYGIIERMYPEFAKLELFCRTPQPGWDVWGNQAAQGVA